jgi:hypothetical protein
LGLVFALRFFAALTRGLHEFAVAWQVTILSASALATVQTNTSVVTDAFKFAAISPDLVLVVFLAIVNTYFISVKVANVLSSLCGECFIKVANWF